MAGEPGRPDPAGPGGDITVNGLSVHYGADPALTAVDTTFPAGAATAVMGPNGAGKSTLLRAILGLVPAEGHVRFADRRVGAIRSSIAYVPQRSEVDWDFPIDVAGTVLLGTYPRLGWLRRPGRSQRDLAATALDRVGLADLAGRQIARLSGGQQQRVFLARALAQQPSFVLLDEPFVGVDATSEQIIVGILHELRAAGATIVVVHHDFRTVTEYFDRVLLLDRQVVADGPVDTALHEEAISRAYRPTGYRPSPAPRPRDHAAR